MAGTPVVIHRGALPIDFAIPDSITKLAGDIAFLLNGVLGAAGTTIATVTTKIKTVNAITYRINGAVKALAATDNFWVFGVAGSNTAVAAAAFQKYLLCVDAAGVSSVLEGTQAATAAAVVLPAAPAGKSVIAIATVQNGTGVNFVPGTTAFNAGSITTTYSDGADAALALGYTVS